MRRRWSKRLANVSAKQIIRLAHYLIDKFKHRFVAYELIYDHATAFQSLNAPEIVRLAKTLNSWWTVDMFAATLAGSAWHQGKLPDKLIYKWARSKDFWWRRLALVCTVGLNAKAWGGTGDVRRTLKVCRMLVDDHEDMVVKAMSWALRILISVDRKAVVKFLKQYEDRLAARVKREVRNKLTTGLKTPRKRVGA